MKITIKQAVPILEGDTKSLKYKVSLWNVSGTYLKDPNACKCETKPFDLYVGYDKMEGDKRELKQLVATKLNEQ